MTRLEALLTTRLEELAHVLERPGAPAAELRRQLERASAATTQAVALELLPVERAEAIWRAARERHPVLGEAERDLSLRHVA